MIDAANIVIVEHADERVASQLYAIFQQSYTHEAQLIGAKDCPPLRRSKQDIRSASATFVACRSTDSLMGIIEVQQTPRKVSINGLAVLPEFFRQGVGTRLLFSALGFPGGNTIDVMTAKLNAPALSLYYKFGFKLKKTWISSDGIELVLLEKHRIA